MITKPEMVPLEESVAVAVALVPADGAEIVTTGGVAKTSELLMSGLIPVTIPAVAESVPISAVPAVTVGGLSEAKSESETVTD